MKKKISILILILGIVGISGCISMGDDVQVATLGDNSCNITELNKTVNGTYSVHGVSFKCSDNWIIVADNFDEDVFILGHPDKLDLLYMSPTFDIQVIPNNEISNSTDFSSSDNITTDEDSDNDMPAEILIKGNLSNYSSQNIIPTDNNLSDQEIIDLMRSDTGFYDSGSIIKVSNRTLNIDNETAYEDVFLYNNLFPPVLFRQITQVLFVKNDKTYLITFEAQSWDYNKEKKDFDMILNSFTVQQ